MHTKYSDGKLELRDLVDLYGKLGFGAIAITDHLCEEKTLLGKAAAYLDKTLTPQSFPLYLEEIRIEADRAWTLYRMLVIPGIEITKNSLRHHRSAHILALGIKNYIRADLSIPEILKEIRSQGAISVAAHPISKNYVRGGHYHLWDHREELKDLFDAWEITDNGELLKAVAETKLPKLANSDLHRPHQIQSWKNTFGCERSWEAVADAIRNQNLDFRFFSSPVEPMTSTLFPILQNFRSLKHLGSKHFASTDRVKRLKYFYAVDIFSRSRAARKVRSSVGEELNFSNINAGSRLHTTTIIISNIINHHTGG